MKGIEELRESYTFEIGEYFEGEDQQRVLEYIESMFFKFSKNQYHYNHIDRIVEKAQGDEIDSFYESIHLPIYYETESLLVNMRSTVDVALNLVNICFDLGIAKNNVTTHSIYFHPKLPIDIKNILNRFTRPKDNPVWSFIYMSRNEIVHEKSVEFVLPLHFDYMEFLGDEKLFITFEREGQTKDIQMFFKQCIQFLESFVIEILRSSLASLKKRI
ncbi:hypothetical protein bcgnr5390_17050 [Bacillus luti]|nr:hypothetical protein BC2903_54310 [Bacillus cereus]